MINTVDKKIRITAVAIGMAISRSGYSESDSSPPTTHARSTMAKTLKIRLTVNGKSVIATLDGNPSARDFHSLLPLTLKLDDYAATEKISYLPRKLSKDAAPDGVTPVAGDIAYYAPWGNLAIYYKDFGYSKGLIKLGTIASGLEALSVPGSANVRIEPIES
jgi:hypothetical protein